MKKLVLVMVMVILMCGCKKTDVMWEENTEKSPKAENTENFVSASEVDFSKCKTSFSEYSFDIDKNGEDDAIKLAVSAETENGKIMWDDLNNWLLTVSVGDKDFVLYDDKVALGNVYYNVFERFNGEVVISVTEESTAHYSVTEYVYTDEGFEKKRVYKRRGN